jgi:hypothetical protein
MMELDTPYVHLRIRDKILVGTYKKNLRINLEIAKEIVRTRLSFTGGKKMPSLILSQGVISMDRPAREYLASEEATQGLVASAIIVNSAFSSFLGNFFMKVNRTKMPVKIFYDISMAEKWLQQFIV